MKDNVIKTVEDLKKNMQILETKMATGWLLNSVVFIIALMLVL